MVEIVLNRPIKYNRTYWQAGEVIEVDEKNLDEFKQYGVVKPALVKEVEEPKAEEVKKPASKKSVNKKADK